MSPIRNQAVLAFARFIRLNLGTTMDIRLPSPIDAFVRAENTGDVEAMSDSFLPYATVRDEDQYIEGLPAIKSWRARMKQQHGHTLTPLELIATEGEATLKAELKGKFPGSPVTARFHFVLLNDQIASLQIRSQSDDTEFGDVQ
jgi:hypothetical protein